MEFFGVKFQIFSLLFARVLAMTSVAPFFSGQTFSFFYRVALSFLISLIVTPVFPLTPEVQKVVENRYFLVILEQVAIGLFIGLLLQFIFAAFQMAGEFFSTQMGIGISEVFDPMAEVSLPLIGTLKNTIALYVFLVTLGHLRVIEAIVYSYQKFPVLNETFYTAAKVKDGIFKFIVFTSSGMFLVALKLALPFLGALLLVSVTLGVLSKAAPQMNLLIMGYPIQLFIAFSLLTFLAPLVVQVMASQFDIFFSHLDHIINRIQ